MDPTTLAARAGAAYGALPMPADEGPAQAMAQAAEDFMATLKNAELESARAVSGQGDPHALVTAIAESRIAVEATVAVRDRMVEAYQELLRMQV